MVAYTFYTSLAFLQPGLYTSWSIGVGFEDRVIQFKYEDRR